MVLTMVNFPLPMETTSLRGLVVEARVWPRKGVGPTMVAVRAEAAVSVAAICIYGWWWWDSGVGGGVFAVLSGLEGVWSGRREREVCREGERKEWWAVCGEA